MTVATSVPVAVLAPRSTSFSSNPIGAVLMVSLKVTSNSIGPAVAGSGWPGHGAIVAVGAVWSQSVSLSS